MRPEVIFGGGNVGRSVTLVCDGTLTLAVDDPGARTIVVAFDQSLVQHVRGHVSIYCVCVCVTIKTITDTNWIQKYRLPGWFNKFWE